MSKENYPLPTPASLFICVYFWLFLLHVSLKIIFFTCFIIHIDGDACLVGIKVS